MLTAIIQDQADRNGRAAPACILRPRVQRNWQGARMRVADPGQPVLDWLDRQLLDAYRRDFPICEMPFAEIARRLDSPADEVLRRFERLERRGFVSQVGLVLAPEFVGASTLVAMAVPKARLPSIAEAVTAYCGVDRMCERQHEFNLWFALAAPNAGELYDAVADIRRRTGVDVLDLRPERRYCGHLGHTLPTDLETHPHGLRPPLDATDSRILAALRRGLSITARPYTAVANQARVSEAQVIERLKRLLREGAIERLGVIGRSPPGRSASALVVFDVPCQRVDRVGERLAENAWVEQCYRCIPRAPAWPYNLYCTLRDDRDLVRLMGLVDEEVCGVVRRPRRAVLPGRARRGSACAVN